MPMTPSMQLRLKAGDRAFEEAQQRGRTFLEQNGITGAAVEAQILILRELIENGKRFGTTGRQAGPMSVHLYIDAAAVTVEVVTPVNPLAHERLAQLDKAIQWIRGYQDPFEPYAAKRREAAAGSDRANADGYGLARIAYEAGAVLDFYVSEDGILHLYAVRFSGEPGSAARRDRSTR
jgi:hypothetical protein